MSSEALPANTADVQYINPPNLLKLKVGEGRLDPGRIARAEAAVQGLASQYIQWATQDSAALDEAFQRAKADPAGRSRHYQDLYQVAHDMKGQGGTFGYPLISRIGDSLCRFLEREGEEASLAVVAAHVDAMRGVLANGMKGDGGELGRQIAEGLEAAATKG